VYQFTNQELTELDQTIAKQNVDETVISFHNVRMYKDAARYHIYKETQPYIRSPFTTSRSARRRTVSNKHSRFNC
jgi:uncharacterized protein YecE (DUF72 family)